MRRELPWSQRVAFSVLLLATAMEVGWPLIRAAPQRGTQGTIIIHYVGAGGGAGDAR